MWHLGLAASDIVMGEQCPETGRLLEQRKQHFGWIECEPGSND